MKQLLKTRRPAKAVTQVENRFPMNARQFKAVLAGLLVLGVTAGALRAAETEGVALAIVYDTSGSMKDNVRDNTGTSSPKYVIANRALIAVAKQIQAFATNSATGAARKIQTDVFTFNNGTAREAIPFGPFDESAIERWAESFATPSGNTPLGNALTVASRTVLNSPLSRKHVLLLTDGMNTAGPRPEEVLPRLKQQAERKGTVLSVHFVAFDVNAKIFEPVKKLGATVVGAADEKQLNSQLEFILQRKILLEEEEPKK
jgi:uncharacterized protein YegL